MSFIQSALTSWWIVVPLLSAPVIIHLINLLRHKKVKWAAMEFLLASQKRNRNYIRFKQLLLLLARMAALALILLLLAGLVLPDQWSKMFGGSKVHHVVLLDDSYSTQDRHDDGTVFDRGVEVVRNIVGQAAAQPTEQAFSLVRFSEAARRESDVQNNAISNPVDDAPEPTQPVDAVADDNQTSDTDASPAGGAPETETFRRRRVNDALLVELENSTKSFEPTNLPADPLEALKSIGHDLALGEDEKTVVYLVSDFRRNQWSNPDVLAQELARIRELGAEIHFVSTVDNRQANLAVTDLRPVPGVHAAGVPLEVEVEVTNFSSEPIRDLNLQLASQTNAADSRGEPQSYSLPAVAFDAIAPGQSLRKTFRVTFQTAGDHQVVARLDADALEVDNERYAVVRVLPEAPVLIVDGLVDSYAGKLLALALSPAQRVRTGLSPRIEAPSFLRENPLAGFQTIFLLNIRSLSDDEVRALNSYVAEGGGVVYFAGEDTSADFVNKQLYADGQGFFPAPLRAPVYLDTSSQAGPDLQVDLTHPIFAKTFGGSRNSFLNLVLIDRYFSVPAGWKAADDDNTQVIATVRGGAPLMIERKFGQGRAIAVLTTASPDWNNWGRGNPTFVITMLELQSYLSAGRSFDGQLAVGSPLRIDFAREMYDPRVAFTAPGRGAVRRTIEEKAIDSETESRLREARFTGTGRPGVYEALLTRIDGEEDVRRFAVNVATAEGDLEISSPSDLASSIDGVDFEYHRSAEFAGPSESQAGFNVSEDWRFFILLILLLIGEQLLAYSASFHPPLKGGSR
ncbi:MAG: BatA domain-containing protein [Pirellulales bacterium]